MITRLIGLPGTGKTTKLLSLLENLIHSFDISDIIFSSYSNAAVEEAKSRVADKFGFELDNMIYFKTLHSLCYYLIRQSNLQLGKKIASLYHFNSFYYEKIVQLEITKELSYDISLYLSTIREGAYITQDNRLSIELFEKDQSKFFYLYLEYLRNNYCIEVSDVVELKNKISEIMYNIGLDNQFKNEFYRLTILIFSQWENYKIEKNLFEYTDMLFQVFKNKLIPDCKVLIVDEFQDTSTLQNQIIELWVPYMERVIVAGDPNQSIYGFNGAKPKYLEEFDHDEHILLSQSYRVPPNIVAYAKRVLPSNWVQAMESKVDYTGEIACLPLENIDFNETGINSVYILARTKYILSIVEEELEKSDIYYSNRTMNEVIKLYRFYYQIQNKKPVDYQLLSHILDLDARHQNNFFPIKLAEVLKTWINDIKTGKMVERKSLDSSLLSKNLGINKYVSLRDKFELLTDHASSSKLDYLINQHINPDKLKTKSSKIKLMTIHASKGKEADMVVIVNAASYYEKIDKINEEEERRLYFVAVTRAKKKLVITNLERDDVEQTKFLPMVYLSKIERQ